MVKKRTTMTSTDPMNLRFLCLMLLLGGLVAGCQSSHEGHTPASADSTASPYAGQETRTIKALSAEDIEGYLTGQGMGLAKAAELNRYPGPKHVLALADELGLDEGQRRRTRRIFEAMEADAIALGRKIVDQEQALDALFAEASADEGPVRDLLHEIGELQADLRLVHLRAHLKMKALLTAEQVTLYDQLRGYDASAPPGQHHQHHEGMQH